MVLLGDGGRLLRLRGDGGGCDCCVVGGLGAAAARGLGVAAAAPGAVGVAA